MLNESFIPFLQGVKFHTVSQAIIITYHDIIWDLLEMLIEKILLAVPKLFLATKDNKLEDIREVSFLIRKTK